MSNVTQEERIKELEEAVGNILDLEEQVKSLRKVVTTLHDEMNQVKSILNVGQHTPINKIYQLESLTDRMQIALETTHSRLTNLETK